MTILEVYEDILTELKKQKHQVYFIKILIIF